MSASPEPARTSADTPPIVRSLRGQEANLGCGTLILIAIIVAMFSGRGNRELESEVSRLRSSVNDLKKAIAQQPGRAKQGQEHPGEHPQEHPKGKQRPGIAKDDLADAIQNYVKQEAALKGGFFLVYDKDAGRTLTLLLERVHRERLSRVAADTYFACADFQSSEGKTYDLDIFMRGPSKEKLEVTEISVHKEEGKARYNWVETKGVWSKVPLK
jgi:hypothetical protein